MATADQLNESIEVAFLRGTGRAPVVRGLNLTQGKFGIGFDVNLLP